MLTLGDIRARYGLPSDQDVFRALTGGQTLPALLYVAPEVHDLEQEKIFARSWQYACHGSRLAKPGDIVLTTSGGIPIMIVRGKDGELRGFVNVCRHRLHPVATANGNERLLRCSYHGWSYDLDGRLRHAPRQDRENEFDCSAISLEPVSVERWDQFVFVNADPDASPLATLTEDIRPRTDELNADLSEYEYRIRYTYEMDCNWKVWAENAIECYHCPTLHRSSFGKAYESGPDDYSIKWWNDTIWHSAPIKWLPKDRDPTSLKGFRFAFLWPNSFFAVDDYVGFVGAVVPKGPERCHAFVDMYTPAGRDADIAEEWLKLWDDTLEEDKLATDRQQLGYRSGMVPHGRLMTGSEGALSAFMRRTWDALSR